MLTELMFSWITSKNDALLTVAKYSGDCPSKIFMSDGRACVFDREVGIVWKLPEQKVSFLR